MHETSLSIDVEIKHQIFLASELTQVSMCKVAKKLIRYGVTIHNKTVFKNSLTEYQRIFHSSCTRLHYRVTNEEHDFFTFSRYFLNTSVSKLLLVGFLLFFKKLINKLIKNKEEIFDFYNYSTLQEKYATSINQFLFNTVKKE